MKLVEFSATKQWNIRRKKLLSTKQTDKNIRDLYRGLNEFIRRAMSLEVTQ
jgi:hypothetical protein